MTPARLAVLAVAAALLVTGCSSATPTRRATTAAPTSRVAAGPAPVATSVPAPVPVATRRPVPAPCAGNAKSHLVRVSLRSQHLWFCARHTLVYSSPVTSGMAGQYTQTPTGTFHVQGLDRNTVLTLNTGKQYDVQYWIPFDAPLFGFHDSSWQTFPYGSRKYRTDGSHGCVHLPLKTIAFLYRWATVGTTVTIA